MYIYHVCTFSSLLCVMHSSAHAKCCIIYDSEYAHGLQVISFSDFVACPATVMLYSIVLYASPLQGVGAVNNREKHETSAHSTKAVPGMVESYS